MERVTRRSAAVLGMMVLVTIVLEVSGQDLEVPKEILTQKNPVAASDAVVSKAKILYEENCLMCHGEQGGGDGPMAGMLKQKPGDLREAAKLSARTDGEIFWVLTKGIKPMPPFESKLSEEERWTLVHLIRSMSKTKPNSEPRKGK